MNQIQKYLLAGVLLIALVTGLCTAAAPCPFSISGGSWSVPDPFGPSSGAGAIDPFPQTDSSPSPAPCPFGGGDGTAAVDPFPPTDSSPSPAPCPFDGGDGTAVIDLSPQNDPAASAVPCPFPSGDATADGINAASAACGDESPAPTDIDGDGTYEDLNGNGRADFVDVILFFKNMAWIEQNQPVCCFDYNGNGDIDFDDLIILFHKV